LQACTGERTEKGERATGEERSTGAASWRR
jgi:hypothetical protein